MQLRVQAEVYEITGVFHACTHFVDACSSQQEAWRRAEGLVTMSDLFLAMDCLVSVVTRRVPKLLAGGSRGPCQKHSLVVKVIVANVASREASVDWESVPAADLVSFGDLRAFLDVVPKKWTAADIGRLFFDRPDWSILLGLFGSLWKPVAEQHSDRAEELLLAVSEPAFCDSAAALSERLGHAVGPATILEALGGW